MATVTTNHEKYSRLLLMIVEGGTKVTRALFEKCYKAMTPKDNGPCPWTVDEFLQANKQKILSYQTGRSKKSIFFPVASGTEMDKWDLYMFCFVLVDVCGVSRTIRMDVDQLKKIRNKLCHLSKPSLDNERYEKYVDKIEVIFDRLLGEINDQVLKGEIADLLQATKEGPLSHQDTLEYMHMFYTMDSEMREILSQQSKDTKEVLEKLRTLLLVTALTKKTETEIVPETVIELLVKNCVPDQEAFISKLLANMFKETTGCNTTDEQFKEQHSKIKESVREIVERFSADDRSILDAEEKCVMLKIKCTSVASLLSLFDDCIDGKLNKEFTQLEARIRAIKGYEEVTLEAVMFEDEFWKTIRKTVSSLEELTARSYNIEYQSSAGRQNDLFRRCDVNMIERLSTTTRGETRIQHGVRLKIQTDKDSKEKLKESVKTGSFDSSINRLRDGIADQYKLNTLSIEARVLDEESPTQTGAGQVLPDFKTTELLQHCQVQKVNKDTSIRGKENEGAISRYQYSKPEYSVEQVRPDYFASHASPIARRMAHSKGRLYEDDLECIVICLKKSAPLLRQIVKDTLQKEIDSWDNATKNDFNNFTFAINSGNISVEYVRPKKILALEDVWEINCDGIPHHKHKAILNKILSMHTNPRNPNIQWNSDRFGPRSEPYWILGKMFMPYKNRYTSTPREADLTSLFDLVKNCKIFKGLFDLAVIEEFCEERNTVMRSCDQRLTPNEKYLCIKYIEAFLKSRCFEEIPEISQAIKILSAMRYPIDELEQVDIERLREEVRQMFSETHTDDASSDIVQLERDERLRELQVQAALEQEVLERIALEQRALEQECLKRIALRRRAFEQEALERRALERRASERSGIIAWAVAGVAAAAGTIRRFFRDS